MFAALLLWLPVIYATPTPLCDENFGFASYYASNMVLQRAPSSAVIWGYTTEVDDVVTVTLGDESYEAVSVVGNTDKPAEWSVQLSPREANNVSVSISASSDACPGTIITLDNVIFGDVYICSGQSNMAHTMNNIDAPDDDIADAVNYPNVRSFFTALEFSSDVQYDLIRIQRNWEEPNAGNIGPYSAVCWLFGRNLYQKYGIPIGLIQTAWGGTRIQAWSSADVNDGECYPGGPGDGNNQNAREALYNAMIHPFLPMPIYGAIWYQGESNQGQPDEYVCAMSHMVRDWREKWYNRTNGQTNRDFPFGQVQLAPNGNDANPNAGFPKLRWAQAGYVGYIPHDTDTGPHDYTKIFMAVAADLPDFDSPSGSIHPRYKRQIAKRLALAAFQVAYGDDSEGRYLGPFPTGLDLDGTELTITYDDGDVELDHRQPSENPTEPTEPAAFEICCADADADIPCPDGDSGWQVADITDVDGSEVTLETSCDKVVTGLRYIWRVTPCERENCPLYSNNSTENGLPAPPYRRDGIIQGKIEL